MLWAVIRFSAVDGGGEPAEFTDWCKQREPVKELYDQWCRKFPDRTIMLVGLEEAQ